MVQAMIKLDEKENRILNIIKGKYGLRNKNQAIKHIIDEYEKNLLEPELKPEYIQKIRKRNEEPTIKIKDFKKHYQPR